MLYNFAKDHDTDLFLEQFKRLREKGAVVELIERARRTRNQNSYLHLLIGVVAMETGNTLEYSKQVYFKRMANPDIFLVTVDDEIAGRVEFLRSSTAIGKEKMSEAIDRFKRWAASNKIYLPEPGDEDRLLDIEIAMARESRNL